LKMTGKKKKKKKRKGDVGLALPGCPERPGRKKKKSPAGPDRHKARIAGEGKLGDVIICARTGQIKEKEKRNGEILAD